MENSAVLLRRLNPYCARALEGAASLCQTRAHVQILLDVDQVEKAQRNEMNLLLNLSEDKRDE
ncbi:hypothetical protein [Serratia rubidaea]|uniref:Uncharacterized protein n=1 Tax=Serratia rubidaea TaxID=61652 RepID=A0A447QSE0_SERRU|nr:hypothetical protein [Serratia rubidaea]MBD8451525.1 hypothetical protein [Serratia rubidaea]MBS0971799.1 hypothetical protein [Serratia rubidaea]MDC6111405.1 hypothetical protein [Serratia rubidaea]UJD79733.1 hypothetical protein FS596_08460 [Serratia rubidaea]UJD84289.1 hypothetical protein FS595_08460 [Serratia rubidaea]